MKILFLLNSLTTGGSEHKIIQLINGLDRLGVGVQLAYLNPPVHLLAKLSGTVKVTALNRRSGFDRQVMQQLRSLLQQEEISCLCCINLYPMLYALPASRGLLLKRVISINTSTFRSVKERLKMFLYRPLLNYFDRLIFGSYQQQQDWQKCFWLSPKQSLVIHNGVDSVFFDPAFFQAQREQLRAEYGIKATTLVIGTVSSFRPEKGVEYLIAALAQLREEGRDVKALLVGDGKRRTFLEQEAERMKVREHCLFVGRQMDVRQALASLDVFVLPSTSTETFSNAALEAMAMGLPLILTDIGGARELVEEHINGLICAARNSTAIAQALRSLSHSTLLQSMAVASRTRAIEHFSQQNMIGAYLQLFQQLNGDANK